MIFIVAGSMYLIASASSTCSAPRPARLDEAAGSRA